MLQNGSTIGDGRRPEAIGPAGLIRTDHDSAFKFRTPSAHPTIMAMRVLLDLVSNSGPTECRNSRAGIPATMHLDQRLMHRERLGGAKDNR